MNEDDLNRQLSEWKVDVPEDPHFRSAVWREIAMRDASSPGTRFRSVWESLLDPRLAVPAGVLTLLVTAALATVHGLEIRKQTWSGLATAYSHSIDPVAHSETLSPQRTKQ